MVKSVQPEVCLDPRKPIAVNKNDRNEFEQVTVPDYAPSLYQMVYSGTVGAMPGNTSLYNYPELGDDDEAHDHPDYMQLDRLDIIEKQEYVNKFMTNPKNHEKKEDALPTDQAQSEPEQGSQK